MNRPTSVLLLSDDGDRRVREEVDRLRHFFASHDVEVSMASESEARGDPDLVLVLGGDGTFLRAAHRFENANVPILGIRFGTFGYLAELEPGTWEPELERLLAGQARVESWSRIRCRVRPPAGDWQEEGVAVNEVVLSASEVARMVVVDLRIDGEDITRYRGDGMIVATPAGSTGHNLGAGGPLVEPTHRCLLLTPIASHALTYRPLVLAENRRVEWSILETRHGTSITVDGMSTRRLEPGTLVELTVSSQGLQVATVVERSRYRTLRDRLSWGLGPGQVRDGDC